MIDDAPSSRDDVDVVFVCDANDVFVLAFSLLLLFVVLLLLLLLVFFESAEFKSNISHI